MYVTRGFIIPFDLFRIVSILGRLSRHRGMQGDTLMDQKAFSINATAQLLSVGRSTVYQLLNDSRLESFKIGRRRLVTATSIARLASGGLKPQETMRGTPTT